MSCFARSEATVALAASLAIVVAAGTTTAVQRHDAQQRAVQIAAPARHAIAVAVRVSAETTHVLRAHTNARRATHRPSTRTAARAIVVSDASATAVVRMPRRARHRVQPTVTGPTRWRALNLAIVRIPSYRPGGAIWLVSRKYDAWGTADWYHDTLYISPAVPANRLYDVAVHEWSHELSVLDYTGDVDAAVTAMNATFGGSGLTGAERAADCMAILQGATWTHYTSCQDRGWRHAAATLLAGRRL